jgi:two-component system, NarL family, sensor kinase
VKESSEEQLRSRNRELSILNAIAEALSRSINIEDALRATLAHVAELFGLRTGWVWLLRPDSGLPYLAASQNLPPALAQHPQRMEGWCYCLETFVAGDLAGAANVNVVTCSRLKKLVDGTDGLRFHASIPLYTQQGRLGVLNVASLEWRELSQGDLRLLHTIGDMLSIAIERARLFARSAELGAVEERNRLARELHDTLAQGMTAVGLQMESVDALLESGASAGRARESLARALTLNRASLADVRRSVLDLRARSLDGRSLVQAVQALAHGRTAPPPVSVVVVGGNQPLPARLEVGLYRIISEALTNVERHAHAARARVRLTITPERVRCIISDDGAGFNPEAVPEGHFGLVGMNERAKLLGGKLHVASAPGRGTRLLVSVPVQTPA